MKANYNPTVAWFQDIRLPASLLSRMVGISGAHMTKVLRGEMNLTPEAQGSADQLKISYEEAILIPDMEAALKKAVDAVPELDSQEVAALIGIMPSSLRDALLGRFMISSRIQIFLWLCDEGFL